MKSLVAENPKKVEPDPQLSPPGARCPTCKTTLGLFSYVNLWRFEPTIVCPRCSERLEVDHPLTACVYAAKLSGFWLFAAILLVTFILDLTLRHMLFAIGMLVIVNGDLVVLIALTLRFYGKLRRKPAEVCGKV